MLHQSGNRSNLTLSLFVVALLVAVTLAPTAVAQEAPGHLTTIITRDPTANPRAHLDPDGDSLGAPEEKWYIDRTASISASGDAAPLMVGPDGPAFAMVNRDVLYASFDGVSWQQTVVAQKVVGGNPGPAESAKDVLFATDGTTMVVAFNGFPYLWMVVNNGIGWGTPTPLLNTPQPESASVAIVGGVPYVTYVTVAQNAIDNQLKVGHFDGINWHEEEITSMVDGRTSIADIGGNPRIAVQDDDGALSYFLKEATWTQQPVATSSTSGVSLAELGGAPAIAYRNGDGKLSLARYSTTWTSSELWSAQDAQPALLSHADQVAISFVGTTSADTSGTTVVSNLFTSDLDGTNARVQTLAPKAGGPAGIAMFEEDILVSFVSPEGTTRLTGPRTNVIWPGTDTQEADTDGDGQSDNHERICGSHPNYATSLSPNLDGDEWPDCLDFDTDGDGQSDKVEISAPCDTNPRDANDFSLDTDGDNDPDCNDLDDDNDGQSDAHEALCGSNPSDSLDANAKSPDLDDDGTPDCIDSDIDGDVLPNRVEEFWNAQTIHFDAAAPANARLDFEAIGGVPAVAYRSATGLPHLTMFDGTWSPPIVGSTEAVRDFVLADVGSAPHMLYVTATDPAELFHVDLSTDPPTKSKVSSEVAVNMGYRTFALAQWNDAPVVMFQKVNTNLYLATPGGASGWTTEHIVNSPIGGLSMATVDGNPAITYAEFSASGSTGVTPVLSYKAHDGSAWQDAEPIRTGPVNDVELRVVAGQPAVAVMEVGELQYIAKGATGWAEPADIASGVLSFSFADIGGQPAMTLEWNDRADYTLFNGAEWAVEKVHTHGASHSSLGFIDGRAAVVSTIHFPHSSHINLHTPTTDMRNPDTDGDGQVDGLEDRCKTDPLDPLDFVGDLDGDRIADCFDPDMDGDGFSNDDEDTCGTDPRDPTDKPTDADQDGSPDCTDDDDDNDGQSDSDETACGSDPFDAGSMSLDTDKDDVLDCIDTDDDNDLLLDDIEYGVPPLLEPTVGHRPALAELSDDLVAAFLSPDGTELQLATNSGPEWTLEVIDTTTGTFDAQVYIVEEYGVLALAYLDTASGSLKVAHHDGTKWVTENVATATNLYDLDSDNGIVTATYRDGDDIKIFEGRLRDSNSWTTETVATADSANAQFFKDLQGPAVAYWDAATGDIMVATEDAGTWTPKALESPTGPAGDVIAHVHNWQARIAWVEEGARVMLAKLDPDGWVIEEPVATGAELRDVGMTTRFRFLDVVYASNAGIHVATQHSEGWRFDARDVTDVGPGLGVTIHQDFTAIGYLDGDGAANVLQFLTDPLLADTSGDGFLDGSLVACNQDPFVKAMGWADTDKDRQLDCSDEDDDNDGVLDVDEAVTEAQALSAPTSGRIDAAIINGKLTVAAVEAHNAPDLWKVTTSQYDGSTWAPPEHVAVATTIGAVSLAPGDTVERVTAFYSEELGSAGKGVLRLVNMGGAPSIIDDHDMTGANMDSAIIGGKLAVSYDQPEFASGTDLTPLMYATLDGATWTPEPIPDSFLPEGPTSLAALEDQPAIAYASGGTIHLALRSSTGWTNHVVAEGNNALPSLTVIDGTLAISYHDLDEGHLMYTTPSNIDLDVEWDTELIAYINEPGATQSHLAHVAGQPVAAYVDRGYVWVAKHQVEYWEGESYSNWDQEFYGDDMEPEIGLAIDSHHIHIVARDDTTGALKVFSSGTDPLNPDTDGDGQTDGHETRCVSDPQDAASRSKDLDTDGNVDCLDDRQASELDLAHRVALGTLGAASGFVSYQIERTGVETGRSVVKIHALDSTQEAKEGLPVANFGFDLDVKGDAVQITLTIPPHVMPDKPWILWHKVDGRLEEMKATFIEPPANDGGDGDRYVQVVFDTGQLSSFSPFTIGAGLPPAAAGGGGGGGGAIPVEEPTFGGGACSSYELQNGEEGAPLVMPIGNASLTLDGAAQLLSAGWQVMNATHLESVNAARDFGFCLDTSQLEANATATARLSVPAVDAPSGELVLYRWDNGTRTPFAATFTRDAGWVNATFQVGPMRGAHFILAEAEQPPAPEPQQDPIATVEDPPNRAWIWFVLLAVGGVVFVAWRRVKGDT